MALQSVVALSNITLQFSSSQIFFTNIPSVYRDLILVSLNATQNDSFRQYRIQINGDTGANYGEVRMYGSGSTTGYDTSTNAVELLQLSAGTGTNFSTIVSHFIDYSATNKHKTILHRGSPHDFVSAAASRWASTAAITSIRVFTPVGEFQAGSIFSLYGRIA